MKKYSDENKPLVTILIVTYNSSKYVLETLESAKSQTYRNIELIITDDCSTDLTIDICSDWIEINRSRFTQVELITANENTGVAANLNRGYRASKAQWIKAIAGDDALLPSCIEDNMNFVMKNPEVKIVHSIAKAYNNSFCSKNFIQLIDMSNQFNYSDKLTSVDQYELLLRKSFVVAPTVFVHIELMKLIGYNDESIPFVEDWPIWLKITKAGEKIHFLNAETVMYRLHDESIQNKKDNKFLYNDYFLKQRPIYLKYINHYVTMPERILIEVNFFFGKLILKYFNRNYAFNRIVIIGIMKVIVKIKELYEYHFIYYRIRRRILRLS